MNSASKPKLADRHRIDADSIDAPWTILDEIASTFDRDPVLQPLLESEMKARLPDVFPDESKSLAHIAAQLKPVLMDTARKSAHPGLFSYISAPGLPTDPFSHALVAVLNQNVVGYHSSPIATVLEKQLAEYFCRLAGLPAGAGGMMLSGGSIANLSAMAVGLHRSLDWAAVDEGIFDRARPIFLVGENVHFSVDRAARVLGVGIRNVRRIPVDSDYRLRVDQLAAALEEISTRDDRVAACVVATAGSTATGAVDPLDEIATVCKEYGVWLHIDAAYGGGALLSNALQPRLRGIEEADSISIDLHKWCYLAFDSSLLLFRDPASARRLWSASSDYLNLPESVDAEAYTTYDLSPEVSRRFRALPAYIALMHYGAGTFAANLEHNVNCAGYLSRLVEQHPDLLLLAAPQLSTLCFRYQPAGSKFPEEMIDRMNTAIVDRVNANGSFLLSQTRLHGRPVIRVCVRSYTTDVSHMEQLLKLVVSLGAKVSDGCRRNS